MRLDDLAVRLVAVEAKLASLTGIVANGDVPTNYDDLDARLSVVETTVDHLITVKTQEHVETIVSAVAGGAPVSIDQVVALSPSANVPEASSLVSDVVASQIYSDAVTDPIVADIISAAVSAVITAEPEVVINPEAIIQAIVTAVADAPLPIAVGNSIANQNISAPGHGIVWLFQGNMSTLQWEDTLLINKGYTWFAPEAEVTSGIVTSGSNDNGIYQIAIADESGKAVIPSSGKVYTFVPSDIAPLPTPEVIQQVVEAVVDIIANATGEEVTPEIIKQVEDAVSIPADPKLDDIEHRLDQAEQKVDSLLGK